jgi:multicomponent Na+:H+ antiporter subunit E
MSRRIATFIASLIVWCLLVYPWSAEIGWDWQSIVIGVLASALAAVTFSDALAIHPARFLSPVRLFWFLAYLPVFVYYCVVANMHVMYLVLHPDLPIKPGVVKVRTRLRSAAARTLLANSITLTPGTLTVDVTDEGYLYVHWLVVESAEMRTATHEIVDRFEGWIEKIVE